VEGAELGVKAVVACAVVVACLASAAGAGVRPNGSYGPVVVFADANHGWAAGHGGIFGTTDGGASWRLESTRPVQLLDAADAQHAWALGGSTLLRTTDGANWFVASRAGLPVVDFVDRERGYALGPYGGLLETRDAGSTWTRLHAPLAETLCATSSAVWLARANIVWRVEGGRAVRQLAAHLPGTGPGWAPTLSCADDDVWALFTGGAAGGSQAYRVLRSLDRGSTWKTVFGGLPDDKPRPLDAYSGPIQAFGRGAAVLSGFCGACGAGTTEFVTTCDGGATIHRSPQLDLGPPGGFWFLDLSYGFFVTNRALWRTSDGGRSWRPVLRSARLTSP
jgi:photosystem II stability/assembly factor-like uncharacterized protein